MNLKSKKEKVGIVYEDTPSTDEEKLARQVVENLTEICNEILASQLFLTKREPLSVLAADIGVSVDALSALLENGTIETETDAQKFIAFIDKAEAVARGKYHIILGSG